MTLHKIIDKICKCFRLAESSNPNEAAAALRQAVGLMQKYDITEEQIESYELLASQMNETSVKSCSSTKPAYWIIALSNLVAEVFDCRVYISRPSQQKPEFIFIGADNRPEVASYLYTILYRNLGRARARFLKNITVDHTIEPGVEAVQERRRRANVFAQAWLFRVSAKVKRFERNAQDKISKSVDDYVSKKYGDTIPDYNDQHVQTDKPDYDDIIFGMRAAEDVNLLRPIKNTNISALAIAAV
jgi:hypothetical protein